MDWEHWAEANARYVGFVVILLVGVLGVVHAFTL